MKKIVMKYIESALSHSVDLKEIVDNCSEECTAEEVVVYIAHLERVDELEQASIEE